MSKKKTEITKNAEVSPVGEVSTISGLVKLRERTLASAERILIITKRTSAEDIQRYLGPM